MVLCAGLALGGGLWLAMSSASSLTGNVLGLGGDPYQTLWRAERLAETLYRGSLAVRDEPFRNFGPLPWLPLHRLFGEPLAYNFVWILQFPLAVVAMVALGRRLGLSPGWGGLAGLLVAFAPYRIAQSLGHFGAMQLFWVPVVFAALLWWTERPTTPRALLAGLLLVGTSWTEHTLFLTTLLGVVVLLVWRWRALWPAAGQWPRGAASALLLLLLVVGLGIAPFWRDLVSVSAPSSRLTPAAEQRLRFTPTLRSLFQPAAFTLWGKKDSHPFGTVRETAGEQVHLIGVLMTALAVFSLRRWRRYDYQQLQVVVALSLLGIVLALAPRIPGLRDLAAAVPALSAVRVVDRFLVLTFTALPLLAVSVLRSWPRRVAIPVSLLLLSEVLPVVPFPTMPAAEFPYARALRTVPEGSVLEVPAATDYLISSQALFASLTHGRRMVFHNAFERVEGKTDRRSLLRVPFLRDILLLRTGDFSRPSFFGQSWEHTAHAALASEKVTSIVVHRSILGVPVLRHDDPRAVPAAEEEIEALGARLASLGFANRFADATAAVYEVPPWPPERFAVVAVPLDGWERVSRRADGTVQAAVRGEARVELRVVGSDVRPTTLTLRVAAGSPPGTLLVEHGAEQLRVDARPGQTLAVPLGTPSAGRTLVRLRAVDAPEIIVENPTVTAR